MKFTFYHNNINVADLDKSIEFYKKALGLKITKETEAADGSFKLVFMGDDTTPHKLELKKCGGKKCRLNAKVGAISAVNTAK